MLVKPDIRAGAGAKDIEMTEEVKKKGENRGGVQTVETVLGVLNAFIDAEPMPMLKTIAERAGMHPAKVHRYLVSLCKTGYVRQDPDSGRYRLGRATLLLGQAAMDASPVIRLTRQMLRDLSTAHQCSAFMALWSPAGPRIVLQEKEAAPISVAAHVGSIFPLLTSATGRAFVAWLPRATTAQLIEQELARLANHTVPGVPRTMEEVEADIAAIRQRGLARATGQLSAAVHGLSAPIFDASENICAVMTLLGQAGRFDARWNGPIAAVLTNATAAVSAQLHADPDGGGLVQKRRRVS